MTDCRHTVRPTIPFRVLRPTIWRTHWSRPPDTHRNRHHVRQSDSTLGITLKRAPTENLWKPKDLAMQQEPVNLSTTPTIHDDCASMIKRQMHIANVARRLLKLPSRDPSDATAITATVNHKIIHVDHPFLSYLQYIPYHTIPGGIYTLLIGYGIILQKFTDIPAAKPLSRSPYQHPLSSSMTVHHAVSNGP